MLTLNDGRNELWQWDTGRKLTVDADCSQVHFSNKVFGRSIDVDVVDGTAAIPDVLLQVDNELIAWAFVGTPENGYTKISKVFKVNKRNKPADYVFTPPEQTTLGQIMKRLDRIEESQDPDAIKNAVDDYLANNPIQIDEKDPTVPAWAKQPQKPSYSAQEVGAESAGTAAAAVSGHNTSADAHNDLRLELKAISNRLNVFFDSDDQTLDELSEIVAYITSNKSLIDAITTSKVSVSDIVNNLTTNVASKPLSAAQGVVLKGLVDAVSRSLSNYQPKGDYLGKEELPAAVNNALAQAKASGEFNGDPGAPGKDGVGIESVEQTFTPTADDAYNVITMKLTDGKTKQFSVKNGSRGSTGATGKTAYEYAKDGGYAGTEAQFAEKLAAEFPTKLPNPNGIHINGTYYDGSEHVFVNIEGGSGSADMGASGGEPGYVKRREFYDEPDKTVADNVSVSSGQYSWISHDIVADHKAATVVYDGVTYECPINFKESITEYGDESYFYIGNWNNSAPEYPFIIFGYINNDAATVNVGSGTHTISVTLKAMLKKIDKKFLPDDIGGETTTKTLFYERDSDADGGIDDYGYIPALEAGVTYEVEWGGEVYTDTAKKVADVLGVSPDDTVTLPDGTEYQPYDDVVWGDLSYFVGGEPTMPIRMEYMEGGSTMLFNVSGVAGVRHVKIYVVEKAPSGGGVSSWNDLADKPFLDETGYLLPETAVTFTVSEITQGMPAYVCEAKAMPKDGENYTVNFDGAEYTCTAAEIGANAYAMGNGAILGSENTGEPFAVLVINGMLVFVPINGATSATVSVYGPMYKPLDTKFILNSAFCPGVIDLASIDGTTITDVVAIDTNVGTNIIDEITPVLDRGIVNVRVRLHTSYETSDGVVDTDARVDLPMLARKNNDNDYTLQGDYFEKRVIFRITPDGKIQGGYIVNGKLPW